MGNGRAAYVRPPPPPKIGLHIYAYKYTVLIKEIKWSNVINNNRGRAIGIKSQNSTRYNKNIN